MKVLSIDIGASSGRFIVTDYDGKNFKKIETFRFLNEMKYIDCHERRDFSHLFEEIKKGLTITLKEFNDIKTIGVDTWAVDYGLLKNNKLEFDPIAYRDDRNENAKNDLLDKFGGYNKIYKETGIQLLAFNTVFQLYDDIKNDKKFDIFLLIPDLINYYLTGNKFIELTNLSTTAIYNPIKKKISEEIINAIGLKKTQIPELIYPSCLVGKLKDEFKVNKDSEIKVISVGSHDTASAVASIELDKNTCYLSSGTWSLLGVENDEPIINELTYKFNFTNEIGLEHKFRFLKNIMGLFIIQEIRKDYNELDNKKHSFQEFNDEAAKVINNDIYVDVDDKLFSKPRDMLNKYYSYLKKTNQYKGEMTLGEVARSIYESMAFKYAGSLKNLEELINRKINKMIVIGGGNQAKLLNQLIANSLNIEVEIGENEATVVGNALAQFIYLKEFKDLKEAREALNKNLEKEIYKPEEVEKFKNKYKKYLEVMLNE